MQSVIPGILLDLRYATAHNFIGRPIHGYAAARCLLTRPAAEALKSVEEELRKRNLALKIYDCYRPQRAVDDFVAWSRNLADQKMKAEFYPHVDKRDLFREGYIAAKSGHSRGSTVDLTIVPLPPPPQPVFDPAQPLRSCENPKDARFADNSIDMGTGFDCFSVLAHTDNPAVSAAAQANRRLLKSVMERHGFVNLAEEWWHYTLREEPYPDTYFDFPIG